jgi:hypothetical protein
MLTPPFHLRKHLYGHQDLPSHKGHAPLSWEAIQSAFSLSSAACGCTKVGQDRGRRKDFREGHQWLPQLCLSLQGSFFNSEKGRWRETKAIAMTGRWTGCSGLPENKSKH